MYNTPESEVNAILERLNENGFIRQYVDYASTQVEANKVFHLGTALALVATVTPPEYFSNQLRRKTNPNIYVWLVGSSAAGKSSAIDIGRTILSEVQPDLIGKDPTASESLNKLLAAQPTLMFVYNELGRFLSSTSGVNPRGTDLRGAFLDYYDGTSLAKAYSKVASVDVVNPRPSLVGGCTESYVNLFTDELAWNGGFCSRFLWFSGEIERKIKCPEDREENREWLSGWLTWSLERVSEIKLKPSALCKGGKFTDECWEMWENWKESIAERMKKEETNPSSAGIVKRMTMMACKVAQIICWSDAIAYYPDWVIDANTMYTAMMIVELHAKCALDIAANIAIDDDMRTQARIFMEIRKDWTAVGEITKGAKVTRKRANEFLLTLAEQGEIISTIQHTTQYWRRSTAGVTPYDPTVESIDPPKPKIK